MSVGRKIIWCALFLLVCGSGAFAKGVHHYAYFNRERGRIADPTFLRAEAFEGAQLKYVWRELEPAEGRYDFSAIHRDLAFLAKHRKKLFIQLQDVSFDGSIVNVPRYLVRDARYHGGADRDYVIEGDDEASARPSGWVARRWDAAVQERFHKLLFALGREFDGRIEGINLPETAVSFGESGRLFPKGFTFERYRDAVIANMKILRRAFPKSVAMQYANFMPGEWLPGKDNSYLRSVYQAAREARVGMGGPDLLPYKRGQMNHSYALIKELDGVVPVGIAVQWDNYEYQNPKTGKRITIPEFIEFATTYLKVDYIFWEFREPFYSQQLMPLMLEKQ
ncbi:MAG TPA: hypothetical protein VGW12_20885 [Pyrinomonadaceae bacterium]|nr:hypothetical protein [Pyrinomonadaceae bacterium]